MTSSVSIFIFLKENRKLIFLIKLWIRCGGTSVTPFSLCHSLACINRLNSLRLSWELNRQESDWFEIRLKDPFSPFNHISSGVPSINCLPSKASTTFPDKSGDVGKCWRLFWNCLKLFPDISRHIPIGGDASCRGSCYLSKMKIARKHWPSCLQQVPWKFYQTFFY